MQKRIEVGIDELGRRLRTFPHHRLKGSDRRQLRVGDYRIIYTFDIDQNTIHLLGVATAAKSIAVDRRSAFPYALRIPTSDL